VKFAAWRSACRARAASVSPSRAPLAEIERFRAWAGASRGCPHLVRHRLQPRLPRQITADELASGKADYNFGNKPPGEEMTGVSAFRQDDASEVFRNYSTYGRGVEVMMDTYRLLDLTPKGRDKEGLDFTMAWVRHHDRYEPTVTKSVKSCCAA
jgi:predicted dithiol-disulfide oxidoreductase (DUF899 family)